MIPRAEAVDRTNGALGNLYQALAGLYERKAQYGRKGIEIMGEGIVAEIFRLRKEIDDLIGLTDYVAEFGVPPTNEEIDAIASAGQPAPGTNGASATKEPSATSQ